jgi:hypothetical protein
MTWSNRIFPIGECDVAIVQQIDDDHCILIPTVNMPWWVIIRIGAEADTAVFP